MKVYRIQDRASKKFKSAGTYGGFSAVGKIWNKIGYIKSAITLYVPFWPKPTSIQRIGHLKQTELSGCDVVEYELTEVRRKDLMEFDRDGGFD